MEEVHGVDVSWLHHSPNHHHKLSHASSEEYSVSARESESGRELSNGKNAGLDHNSHHSQQPLPAGPDNTYHDGSERQEPSPSTVTKSSKESRGQISRRNSWMSSISSKFSSTPGTHTLNSGEDHPTSMKSPKSSQTERPSPVADYPAGARDMTKAESPASTPPASPKAHTFLQNAFRRLSSSGGSSIGKAAGTGGLCARRTMNVDPYRERCTLPILDAGKLRRVAFCVDVEIAGSAQYVEDLLDQTRSEPTPEAGSGQIKHDAEPRSKKTDAKQQKKDRKLKRSEGEALKRPDLVADKNDQAGVVDMAVNGDKAMEDSSSADKSLKEPSKKKEKKKRSEGERKERKEKKMNEAIASGSIPAEIKSDGSGDSGGGDTPSKGQECPTTDPLRIYRRCCSLRETQPQKRIAEQISSPSACSAISPGVVSILDLSGYRMQLHDIITLGDYLAVVPVKKVILEDCGLGDESIRVILAGLLAAKTIEQAKHNRKLKKMSHLHQDITERSGVVEKLSLKNNPKISADGWRHIALFVYMSRSLKAIDLSMIPFPQQQLRTNDTRPSKQPQLDNAGQDTADSSQMDIAKTLQEAIAERLGGSRLEELVMAECGLDTACIGRVVDAAVKCGITRLGLASNNLSKAGLEHVVRFLQSGICEGLDIGGNDVNEHIDLLAEALGPSNTLWALCLADCQLSPSALERLLPVLVLMPNCRFMDLSRNRQLFTTRPSALGVIRKYLPRFPMLKRLHLMDVDMTSEHAIALAETLPESRVLAHLNILENRLLSPLASAKSEADQEEACAFYASLMAAVRVSETIICIDIDVPRPDSSEVVKALAKQVVAYSLRNLERLPLSDVTSDIAASSMAEPHGGDRKTTVPDVLLHLVGNADGDVHTPGGDQPAPDDDYIVGGTGVVKALDICLNRAENVRKDSMPSASLPSGSVTPRRVLQDGEVSKGKAKEMSKSLLESARKIRTRLQPALLQEAKAGNDMSFRRLQFLDSTLQNMIQRFENEYPETRLGYPAQSDSRVTLPTSSSFHPTGLESSIGPTDPMRTSEADERKYSNAEGLPRIELASTSRRASSPSLASRQAQEEGRMHRFGQRVKRDILRPETQDYAHGTTGQEEQPDYIKELRRRLEAFGGDEIKERVEQQGPEAVLEAIGADKQELMAQWEREDPKRFEEAAQGGMSVS